MIIVNSECGPFADRKKWYIVSEYFIHKSPVNRAREVFKPSTDSGSPLVSIYWGFLLVTPQWVHVFPFWRQLSGPVRQANEPFFWFKIFLETRWSSASLKPLIDLLAYLDPELWLKKTFFTKIKIAGKVWYAL